MAGTKRPEGHAINVAVVGLSGTDKEKGVTGVGKSCLCNRFVRPLADRYYTDHISVLSQSDFGGRVVNNDHFLYWGEVAKINDEGTDYTFRVIEQTEFIDDSTFTPFRIGKTEPYHKRCALTKLQSAEKLMYLCKNQLGLEQEFEQQLLPDGKFLVDGFVCVFDVSEVSQRTVERQVEMTVQILNSLLKTKKPVVLVTTKNDEARDVQVKEVEKLVNRKEFRGIVHLVETSALLNVNVECAFLLLAHLIEKTRNRPKVLPYLEAARIRTERMEVARDAYSKLISNVVTDYKMFWILAHKSLQTLPDYVHFVELFGTEKAKEIFMRHTTHLREQFIQSRKQQHFERLKQLLPVILPDLNTIADRSWLTILRWLPSQSFYDTYFQQIAKGESWRDPRFLENIDDKFPSDLLDTTEADALFRNHAKTLRGEQRRHELMHQFKQLIEEKQTLCRGKTLRDAYVVFMGHECYSNLSEADRQQVYDDAQQEQRERARNDFHELLLENMPLVTSLERKQRQLTSEDLNSILDVLRDEPRYEAVTRPEDRKTVLLNLLGFIQHASRDRCHAKAKCADVIIQQVLSKKGHRPTSLLKNNEFLLDSGDRHLNLIFLGQEPLADELVSRVRELCVNDEYTSDGDSFTLDYRPIDGDVSLPQNSFKTATFVPNGCFCVYNSTESLEYVRDSLEKTLFSEVEDSETDVHLHGLPIVIVLAHDPAIASENALEDLRIRGHELANRLQCSFTDTPSSLLSDSTDLFHNDQVALAMHSMVQDIRLRSLFIRVGAALDVSRSATTSPTSDIRVLLATMCGDQVPVDLILAPLLSHQLCYVTVDKAPVITLETMVNDARYKVEVIVCSFHNAMLLRRDLHHGLILVYSTRRKASLSNLRALVSQPLRAPTLILAVTEGQANTESLSKSLLAEGTNFAQNIGASFVTVTNTFAQQTTTFTPFFVTCLGEKEATVRNHQQVRQAEQPQREHAESVGERMARRPPAELPVGASTRGSVPGERHNGIMWNNEPIYSRLRSYHSDSDLEGVGSPSPPQPPVSPYGDQDDDEIYSEINSGDTTFLLPQQSSTPNDGRASSAGRPRHRQVDFSRQSRTLNSLGSASQHSMSDGRKTSLTSGAPLALPEHVEINSDYSDVRDAILPRERPSLGEPLYADVQDALPEGTKRRVRMSHIRSQSARGDATSDSETDIASRLDIYKLMQRRPTPYKKKPSKQQQRTMDFERHMPHRQLTVPVVDHRHFAAAMNQSLGEYNQSTADDVWTQRPTRSKLQRSKAAGDSGSETIGSEGASWAESEFASGVYGEDSYFSRDKSEDGEMDSSSNWMRKLLLRTDKDTSEKLRRKEERKLKEDEKKKQKEEERQQKEMQRVQKKIAKRLPGRQLTLDDYVMTASTLPVPPFVEMCVHFVELEGLTMEGVYRTSGNKGAVDQFMEKYLDNPQMNLDRDSIPVTVVTTALKQFFSELVEPLISKELCEELLTILGVEKSTRLAAIRGIVKKLPAASIATLGYLMAHLYRISCNSAENSMTAQNLAICWCPTLMRPTNMALVAPLAEIVQILIEQYRFLFYGENEI